MLFFTEFSLITSSSGSASFASWPSSTGLGIGSLTSLQLLKVITTLTSSILGFGSLQEGNFPFSCTCCWLVSLEIEYYRLSNFWEILVFRFSIFLFSVPSTVSILWLVWAFTALCSSTKLPTTLLKFMTACSTGDEDGGGCGWDEDPYCCCAAGGTYGKGFGFQERIGWFL